MYKIVGVFRFFAALLFALACIVLVLVYLQWVSPSKKRGVTAMLETLAMSSVLITALCLIRTARGRVSARLIYSLWLVAALRLMLPFSLAPSLVSVANLAPELHEAVIAEPAPDAENPKTGEAIAVPPEPGAASPWRGT